MRLNSKVALAAVATAVLGFALTACGGGGSTTESTTGSAGEGSGGSTVAAAKEAIAPFIGQPSPFPVTEKLKEVPKGAKIAYMDCGTPVCSVFWQLLEPAAQTMGVNLTRVKAGQSASSVSAAFDTVVAQEPTAVIVPGINVELWKSQLKELQEAEIPVVTTGVTGTEPYGVVAPQFAEATSEQQGRLMADYVAAELSDEANVAMYEVPELNFTAVVSAAFKEELESVCPKCSFRTVDIPVAELGNTAPNTIVSDLQANPETTVAVFGSDETETGLPAALTAAGIEVETMGAAPTPTNLQYVKEGKETVALATDFPVLIWSLLDQAARESVGQELTGLQAEGLSSVIQFLKKDDLQYDVSKGWTGYPDFAEKYAKLWGVEG